MKRNLILTSTLIMTLSLVGCGQKNTDPSANSNEITEQTQQTTTSVASMDDIKSTILTTDLLRTPFDEAIDAKESFIFGEVADKIEEGFVSQAMMNVKFQDVIVVKTSDVETIKTTIEDYLASDIVKPFQDGYGGDDNIEAVNNAILSSTGDYVYLIATPNAKDIESKLLEVLN